MSTSVHTASVSASGHPAEAYDKGGGALFTPAPWRIVEQSRGWDIYAGGYFVCEVPDVSKRSENIANARLISAAPELLIALQMMEKAAQSIDAVVQATASRMARAAIAKATS